VNSGDDSSRDSAKEGDVAKDDLFATKGDLAEDGGLAFSSDGDITTVGDFAKEGDVAMTSTFAKRVLLLTKALSAMECSIANGVEGVEDGTLAIDGDLAKQKQLRQGGQCYHERNFAGDGCLPSPRQSTLLKLANIAKDGNCATRDACAKGGVIAKEGNYAKGCNFTKEVKLVEGSNLAGNGNFADDSNFAECSNAAKEVCDSTDKNNSGLNKRQCYRESDATSTMTTCHRDEVKMPAQCWLQCEVPKVTTPAQPAMTPA
jgi:hypothetical protein